MIDAELSQTQVAAALGCTAQAVQHWVAGKKAPPNARVFALEALLEVGAGTLSKHLGFMPVKPENIVSVSDAILSDPTLTSSDRQVLRHVYDLMRLEGQSGSRPGPAPPSPAPRGRRGKHSPATPH